jgi:predicted DNA binding CopG/RHH family protein
MNLSNEEKEILESFERDEWTPVKNLAAERKRISEYARATMRKDKRVNIRISQRDLMELQRKAVHEGLPYQTFISSLLHKFVNGKIAERPAH